MVGKTMHQLEVFQYTIALYLNTGYYTIDILTPIKDVIIFFEFGKLWCNSLQISMYGSGNKFQDKSDNILIDIEVVQTYTNGILVLHKYSFPKYIYCLRGVLSWINVSELKANAPKCNFGLNWIPYLGNIINQE